MTDTAVSTLHTERSDVAQGRFRSTAILLVGLMAMAIGLGFSIQYLKKTGMSPASVAGVALFGSGLTLLVTGGARLVRSAPRWGRIPSAVALVVVIFASTWVVAQATAIITAPRTALGDVTPGTLGLPFSDVEFASSDGVTLSAWYLPSRNGAGVVLAHGSGSNRSSVLDHAAVLAGHGYGVLAYDARGHGRSGGRTMDIGWFGDEDMQGAVSYLTGRPEIDPGRIAVVGLSKGGEEAIGAAAADPRIAAVVAEGASGRTAEDHRWLADRYGWRGAVQIRIDRVMYGLVDLFTAAHPPIALRSAVSQSSPRPLLLIAAGAVESEVNAATYLREGSPGTVTLWVVPESTHVAGLTVAPEDWERRVVTFLDRALRLPEGEPTE